MATLQAVIDARRAREGSRIFNQSVRSMQDQSRRAGRELRRTDQQIERIGRTSGAVRRQIAGLFGGITAGLAARQAISTISDFQTAIVSVGQVSGATEEQFERLEATARQLGATTRFSATQAGEGLLFLARAGFDVDESISALPATLNLATAGQLELGRAADIASNVLSQFDLQAEETTRVVDVLAKTANSSNTDIEQLSEALKLAGPVAGALKIPIEDTAAAIGVLGDSGIQASLAGTNLRGILAALLSPTQAGIDALDRLGLTIEELDPSTVPIVDIFREFQEAGLGAADAVDLFGRRNVAAALVLSNNVGRIEEIAQANREAEGTAQEFADALNNTLAGSFRNLISAVQEAFLTLGDKGLLGSLKGIVDFTTDVVRELLGIRDASTELTIGVQTATTAIKALAVAGAALTAVKVGAALTGIASGLAAIAAANPVTAIAASLVGLGFALDATVNNTDIAIARAFALQAENERLLRQERELDRLRRGQDLIAPVVEARERTRVSDEARDLFGLRSGIEQEIQALTDLRARVVSENLELTQAEIAKAADLSQEEVTNLIGQFGERVGFVNTETARQVLENRAEELRGQLDIVLELMRQERERVFREIQPISVPPPRLTLPPEFEPFFGISVPPPELEETEDALNRNEIAADRAASAISSFFSQIAQGADQAERAVQNLIQSLLQIAFEEAVGQPLREVFRSGINLVSGFFSPGAAAGASGLAFNSHRIIPAQTGTVLPGPTLFPISPSLSVLGGEAGDEALLPLTRTRSGELGVRAEGQESGTIIFQQFVSTPDVGSFRRSRRQLYADLQRVTGLRNGLSRN